METQDTAEFDFLQSNPASTSGRSDAEQLKSALMNEKAAPEILQFETDLVGRIESNMDYQVRLDWQQHQARRHVHRAERQRQPAAAACAAPRRRPQDEQIELLKENDDMKLVVEIFMSELSRIRYLLRAYLRVRLQKVERHVMYILDNAGELLVGPSPPGHIAARH